MPGPGSNQQYVCCECIIIYYSSAHFPINTFPPPHFGWVMLHSFSSYFLCHLTFVQFGIHSVVSSYAWFTLCHLSRAYTFPIIFIPHCKYFFSLSSCTRNLAHNAVNTRSQSLLHRKCTCTRPVRQMPFGVTTLKIEVWQVSEWNIIILVE